MALVGVWRYTATFGRKTQWCFRVDAVEVDLTQSLPGWGALFWVLDSSPRYLGVGGWNVAGIYSFCFWNPTIHRVLDILSGLGWSTQSCRWQWRTRWTSFPISDVGRMRWQGGNCHQVLVRLGWIEGDIGSHLIEPKYSQNHNRSIYVTSKSFWSQYPSLFGEFLIPRPAFVCVIPCEGVTSSPLLPHDHSTNSDGLILSIELQVRNVPKLVNPSQKAFVYGAVYINYIHKIT